MSAPCGSVYSAIAIQTARIHYSSVPAAAFTAQRRTAASTSRPPSRPTTVSSDCIPRRPHLASWMYAHQTRANAWTHAQERRTRPAREAPLKQRGCPHRLPPVLPPSCRHRRLALASSTTGTVPSLRQKCAPSSMTMPGACIDVGRAYVTPGPDRLGRPSHSPQAAAPRFRPLGIHRRGRGSPALSHAGIASGALETHNARCPAPRCMYPRHLAPIGAENISSVSGDFMREPRNAAQKRASRPPLASASLKTRWEPCRTPCTSPYAALTVSVCAGRPRRRTRSPRIMRFPALPRAGIVPAAHRSAGAAPQPQGALPQRVARRSEEE
ncbi:hypothetical protein VTO73DRAFT_5349 [Trametes versicolor]